MASIEQDALFRRVTQGNHLTPDRLTDQSVARVIKKLAAREADCKPVCRPQFTQRLFDERRRAAGEHF
jgi:hypothetical protein